MSSEAIQLSASVADSVERTSSGSRLRQRTTVLSIASSSSTHTTTGFLLAIGATSARQPSPPAAAIGDPLDLVQRDEQRAHAGEPRLRGLLQARRDDISQLGGQWAVRTLDERDRRREVHHTQRAQVVVMIRRAAGQQLEQHGAEAVLVRAVGRREPAQLLRRDVRRRAEHELGVLVAQALAGELGEPEVDELDAELAVAP